MTGTGMGWMINPCETITEQNIQPAGRNPATKEDDMTRRRDAQRGTRESDDELTLDAETLRDLTLTDVDDIKGGVPPTYTADASGCNS